MRAVRGGAGGTVPLPFIGLVGDQPRGAELRAPPAEEGCFRMTARQALDHPWIRMDITASNVVEMSEEEGEESSVDEGSVDEVYYKYIPPEELLPVDMAAPCVAHLL